LQYKITDFNGNENLNTVENINDCIFFYGGGNSDTNFTINPQNLGYGSFIITPEEDFIAWVELWGGDGGTFGTDDKENIGGIGGYTKALVKFKKDINYTVVVGQGGGLVNINTHGGGGKGHMLSGQGGGLSGLFIDTSYYGKELWDDDNISVSKSKALLIAGGGGGKGGTNNKIQSMGGNGGGWMGTGSYNSESTLQERDEEDSMIGKAGIRTGNNGGAGGGWLGGLVNTDSTIINTGGSGGSGYIVSSGEYSSEIITGITKYGSTTREDIYKNILDPSKFTIVGGIRGKMEDNKYKNMYTPQNGRVIITLSDGNFNTLYYPSEIKPLDTYATINL
jgi:hypothetical protein